MTVYDDEGGNGSALYAGGWFENADGTQVNHVARWDGHDWSSLDSGADGVVLRMYALHGGECDEPLLYVGGFFTNTGSVETNGVAAWNGEQWSALGNGPSHPVRALASFDDQSGHGTALYVGGVDMAGGITVNGIARWNGTEWSPLGTGTDHPVFALTEFDEGLGNGPALFAGGGFSTAGGVDAPRIARWDGAEWSSVGSGFSGGSVRTFATCDDCFGEEGPLLFAGGAMMEADGIEVNRIAQWNGDTWSPLGSGMNSLVFALTVFDDGSGAGPALYAGGLFDTAGGIEANGIARWSGSEWSSLDIDFTADVRAMAVFDAGDGPALYLGGRFWYDGSDDPDFHIGRWDGVELQPVGDGPNALVHALAVFDNGSGSGPALYAGGNFTEAGGEDAMRLARWDGNTWSSVGSNFSQASVLALHPMYDEETNQGALYVGGAFPNSVTGDRHIARYRGCPIPPECDPADLNCDGVVDGTDLLILLSAWGECPDPDDCPADLNGDGVVDGADLLILLSNWG